MNPVSPICFTFRGELAFRASLRFARNASSPRNIGIVLSIAAVYLLFFHRLAARDLWSSHEARAGMDAQMILDENAWGLPQLYDGRLELQKPPLYYWLVAGIARLRGGTVDAWAVRLPAAGAALLCVLAVLVGLGRGRQRTLAGLLAGGVLATAVHFTWLARIGRIDMPLALSVTLAVGGLYLGRGMAGWSRLSLLVLAYLAIAAGVLLKGPIGFVLPVTVMLAHLALECGLPRPRRWSDWRRSLGELGVVWGVPLVVMLTLSWFLWVNTHTNGEFFRVFLWHHNLERGWGGSSLARIPGGSIFPNSSATSSPGVCCCRWLFGGRIVTVAGATMRRPASVSSGSSACR